MITTTTTIIRLENSPETSSVIGQLTSQQRLAYNQAVNVLNREPKIPKRAKNGSDYGLSKRITRWRNTELVERGIEPAPYHIHQQGSEAAWQANALMRDKRLQREERIAQAIDAGDEPHPSDVAPHRRTLAHRSRKHGTQTLTIRGKNFIHRLGNRSFRLTGVDHVVHTRDPLPDHILALHFVEMSERRRSVNAPLECRLYELHVAIEVEVPVPPDLTDVPLERYDGMDDGVVNNWTFSNGEHYNFVEPYPNRDVGQERHVQQGKQKGSKRKARHQRKCDRKSHVRREERKRQFNHHAIAHLDNVRPAAMAIERKHVVNLMRSASGPGKKRKAALNHALALTSLSALNQILGRQCLKRGVHVLPVPARGSSQSCPNCGYRHRRNRETQARFRCRSCGWSSNADHSASIIHRNRAFVRTTERIHGYTPYAEDLPTGWQEQPSRPEGQPLPSRAQNAHKPKRTRRTRRAAQAPDGQGPEREARQPRSWVQSDLPSQTAAHLRKPGLPKAYKPVGRE